MPSKQGWLYVFDRITGAPIWPMPETPVPQSDMPFEKTAKTQPIPSKPPAYSRTFVGEKDIIDFTPALSAQALENLKLFRWEQSPYVPPVGPNSQLLGTINIGNTAGGVNWPGSGFDPETGIFYTQASNSASPSASTTKKSSSAVNPENQAKNRVAALGSGAELRHAPRGAGGCAGWRPGRTRWPGWWRRSGSAGLPRRRRAALVKGLDGLSDPQAAVRRDGGHRPNNGTLKWQVPHGDTPDDVRNHPLLKGLNIPKTGQSGSVGVLVTKTLVIAGDPQVTDTARTRAAARCCARMTRRPARRSAKC